MFGMDTMLDIGVLTAPAPKNVCMTIHTRVVLCRHHSDTTKVGTIGIAVLVSKVENIYYVQE